MTNQAEKIVNATGVAHTENVGILPTEKNLVEQASGLQEQVEVITIQNDEDYQQAGELGVQIKTKTNEVVAWFKPMKEMAHKTHKSICEREKTALAPMVEADRKLKAAMKIYDQAVTKARKEAEETARKAAQEEADRKLQEAIALETDGQEFEANMAVMEAEMAYQVASTLSVHQESPKVSGVSSRKAWEITGIDFNQVPDELNGVPLKVIDQKAVMQLIKASKGKIQIPGIRYEETSQISFRGGKTV